MSARATFHDGRVTLYAGDCLAVLKTLPDDSVDACVTDPPYHLTAGKKGGSGDASVNPNSPAGRARISTGFMGKTWDGGDIAFRPELWREVLRVLKPGGHLAAFSGDRTYARMVVAIEDAGFQTRHSILDIIGADTHWRAFVESLNAAQFAALTRLVDETDFGGMLGRGVYGDFSGDKFPRRDG